MNNKTPEQILSTPITSKRLAREFIRTLISVGALFHFDDDPALVYNTRTGNLTFTFAQAVLLRSRLREMRALKDFCPFSCAIRMEARHAQYGELKPAPVYTVREAEALNPETLEHDIQVWEVWSIADLICTCVDKKNAERIAKALEAQDGVG